MNSSPHEVLGIGAPIVDYVIHVSAEFLTNLPGTKAGMLPVDYQTFLQILEQTQASPELLLGGSSANTIRGLAYFGHSCAILGRIGADAPGEKFTKGLETLGVKTSYLIPTNTPTSQVISLVSPDKERTMRAFLGASREILPEDLSHTMFQGSKIVHLEGYNLLNLPLLHQAMEMAKEAGAKISLDLGSHEIVQMHRETILNLLERYVDIVFANRLEVELLTQLSPEKATAYLRDLCSTVVILLDKEGCIVAQDTTVVKMPAHPVETLVDTTGAGDIFASGFLHGYLLDRPLEECARYGVLAGAAIIQVHGVEMPHEAWKELHSKMKDMPLN
jgi:sugar/nucleoside kinase (ribokinase family)